MTLAELQALVEDAIAEHGEEMEVRFAHQPSYPMAVHIQGNALAVVDGVAYLAEDANQSNEYLPGDASAQLGWR